MYMNTMNVSARTIAFDAAVSQALERLRTDQPASALEVLARAHVLGQPDFDRHLKVHWLMLRAAYAMRDGHEMAGQVLRLLLVPLGHLSGRLPKGNPGTADVSAFAPQAVAPDLQLLFDEDEPTRGKAEARERIS
jgi:hypothetical protein